jgi:hypothetical protein
LALVSAGIKPGLVTVALESWYLGCKPTRPSRGGFVCPRVDKTRVSLPLTGKPDLPFVRSFTVPASHPVLRYEHAGSVILDLAGGSFRHEKRHPRLFSAALFSR